MKCAWVCVRACVCELHLLAFSWPGKHKLNSQEASFIDSFMHSELNFRMRKVVGQHMLTIQPEFQNPAPSTKRSVPNFQLRSS